MTLFQIHWNQLAQLAVIVRTCLYHSYVNLCPNSKWKSHNHVHCTAIAFWDHIQTRKKCEIWQVESIWARPHCYRAWYWPFAPLMRRPQAFYTFLSLSLWRCMLSKKNPKVIDVSSFLCVSALISCLCMYWCVLEIPSTLYISWITWLFMNIFKCVNMGPDLFSIWCTHTYAVAQPSLKCLPGVADSFLWINMDRMHCGVVDSVSPSSWQDVPLGCYFLTWMFSLESENFYLIILTRFRIVNVLHKDTWPSTRG